MQIRDDLRTAFLRWRDEGDLAALTAVFDRIAQELLLVASHVASTGQQPEDLLQETFLTAIQKADRYDGNRPLEPWLIGILVNVARSGRRQLQRERTGVEVADGFTADDPTAAVAANELAAGLHEAIAGLPVPQREVMTLHLVHGMTPTEIAHATSRPVGTVKSWIHRSLDHVRKHLPVGLAVAFTTLLRGMTKLADVRRNVLAQASTASGAASAALAAAARGTSTFGRLAPRLAGALLAGLGGAFWLLSPPAASTATTVTPPVAAAPDAPGASGTAAAAPTADAPTESRTAAPPAATVATLTIVAKPDGEPFPVTGFLLVPGMADADLQRVPFTTGERGSYTIRGVPFGDYLLQLDRTGGQLVTVDRAEQTIEVAIARGVDVHGRVVDGQGHGVAAAGVWLNHGTSVEDRVLVASTDPAGRFVVRDVPAGRYLSAERAGSLPSCYAPVAATGADQRIELELRLDQPAATVVFEVVDPAGAPIANALVQVGDNPPRAAGARKLADVRPPWRGRTDQAGRATCEVAPMGLATPVFARAARTCAVEHSLDGSPLAAPVRLVLARGGSIRGTLAEAEPVPGLVVARAHGERTGPTTPLWCLPSCVTSGRGQYALYGVPPGRTTVRLRAGDDVAERTFEVREGDALDWSPRLAADGVLRGRLDGLAPAVAGTLRIELRATARRPLTAAVDADGGFLFTKLPGRDFELVVLPRAPTADLVLLRRHPVRSGDTVQLALAPEAAPTATVTGRARDPGLQHLSLTSARGTFTQEAAGDGVFTFAAVPPGLYHLVAGRTRVHWHRELRVDAHATIDLGTITTEPTTTVTVECAAASGAAPIDLQVWSADALAMLSFARHRGDPAALELPHGRWQIELWRQGLCLVARTVDVADTPQTLRLEPAVGDAVLLSAAPAVPTLALPVHWQVTGAAGRQHFFTRRPESYAAHRSAGLPLVLAPGDYEIAASTLGGPVTSQRLRVPVPPGQAVPPMLVH